MAIKFPLRTAFAVLISCVFIFIKFQELLFCLLFLIWPTNLWTMCYSASNYLCIFCCYYSCWVLVLLHCYPVLGRGLFKFSYIFWGLLYFLIYVLFWRKFHGLIRRMYIVLLHVEIFCICQLGTFDLWCDLVLEFLYYFFV
jgi:hypothetical protein